MGAVYLFHDLYGYLMEMSPDIATMIEAFDDGVDTEETIAVLRAASSATPTRASSSRCWPRTRCSSIQTRTRSRRIWAFVPINGKWNVWQRRDDRLTLWTAWGERPVQQMFLDPEETAIWDAFDGKKRLIELRHHHDNAKLLGARAQARPQRRPGAQALDDAVVGVREATGDGAAVPDLDDAVPDAGQPGTRVPGTREADAISPRTTTSTTSPTPTRSSITRRPRCRTCSACRTRRCADARTARRSSTRCSRKGALPAAGRVRVLEIGAGLGYVARDAIARLRERAARSSTRSSSSRPRSRRRSRSGSARTPRRGSRATCSRSQLPDGAFDLILATRWWAICPRAS